MKKISYLFLTLAMVVTAGLTLASCSNDDNPSVPQNSALAQQLVGEWIFEQATDGIEDYDFGDETESLADGATIAILYYFHDDGRCWKEINLMRDGKLVDQPTSLYATDESTYTIDASGRVVIAIKDVDTGIALREELTFDGTRLTTQYAGADVPITLERATDAQTKLYQAESDAWHGGSDDNAGEAEGHPFSESVVGEIVGSDGLAYAVADKDRLPEGVSAVAMVAYKSGENGLAIALTEEKHITGNKYISWRTAKSLCERKTAVAGGTWRLPSIQDWQNMFIGCGTSGTVSDNPSSMSYSGLASKLAAVSGSDLLVGTYWSSTERTPNLKAWYLLFAGGTARFSNESEDRINLARACLAF